MTAVSDGLAHLSKLFVGQLPRRMADIAEHFHALLDQEWDLLRLDMLHRLVHGLTGSAGTFGLPQVSQAAQQLEQALARHLGQLQPPADCGALRATFQHLLGVVEQELGTPSSQIKPTFKRPLRSPMVYVVDDDAEQTEHLRHVLVAANYQVRCFTTVEQFRQACEQKAWPNVVIMDVIFPEGAKAGLLAIAELRAQCPPDLPVIFTSVRDDLEARLLAYRAGAARYLVKPVYPNLLLDLMARITLRAPTEPYRVLLIDDDLLLVQAISAMLRQAGMKVRSESSAIKATQALPEFNPDVLLLDLYMPNFNGTDLAMVLREQDQYAALPIIFLSTETDLAKQNVALKLGGDDFLLKPVQALPLIQAVSNHAKRRREILQSSHLEYQRELDNSHQEFKQKIMREQDHERHLHADFLNNLCTPLRTPLNLILGYAQLLQMKPEGNDDNPDSVIESAQEIARAGQQLLSTINDLLDLSKIDANRMEVQLGPVWLDEVLLANESAMQPLARANAVNLVFSQQERKNIMLRSDGNRLIQILNYLVHYAIRHCSAPHTISVNWHMSNHHTMRIVIQSKDGAPTGGQWQRIIQRNHEAGASESQIGLLISHCLAQLMGARLGVDEVLEQTLFWLELPQLSDIDSQHPDDSTGPVRPGHFGKRKVLYIEDSVTNQRLMRKILLRRPHLTLEEAPNAEVGLPLARTLQPDLILLDLNLPGMSGYSALPELRRIPGLEHTPVIAITANAMKGDAERGLGAGFSAYVVKPVDINRLYALLDQLVPASAS
ncbi:MAG: hypothetical protein RL748_3391 [Pseudomonadota bacterium]